MTKLCYRRACTGLCRAKDRKAASLSGKAMITIKWSDSIEKEKEKRGDAKVGRKGGMESRAISLRPVK